MMLVVIVLFSQHVSVGCRRKPHGPGRERGGRPDNAQNGPVTLPVCSGLHTSESASPSVAGASNPLER